MSTNDPRIEYARDRLREAHRAIVLADNALRTIGPGEPASTNAKAARDAISHVIPWLHTARREAHNASRTAP